MTEAIELLKKMISVPSVSRSELMVSDVVELFLIKHGVSVERYYNNVWALAAPYDAAKPTLMLNSHLDTVKPAAGWTLNPHDPVQEGEKLYGLGSNDAGASVVSLISAFLEYAGAELPINLLLAITAEEEVGGENGIRKLLPYLRDRGIRIDMALVGEPTGLHPAVGERGLVVLDCVAPGRSGHAARGEGVNALYNAIADIEILRNFKFEKESALLGPIGIAVTMIEAGTQHNVVPSECKFVVDVRTTDAYSNEQTVEILSAAIKSKAMPRSTRVQPSALSSLHPLYKTAVELGGKPFVSPTTSDMSLLHGIPSIKIGPGDSARSHKADEFVYINEVTEAIEYYKQYIKKLVNGYETME